MTVIKPVGMALSLRRSREIPTGAAAPCEQRRVRQRKRTRANSIGVAAHGRPRGWRGARKARTTGA
jgi:hypothetical protein